MYNQIIYIVGTFGEFVTGGGHKFSDFAYFTTDYKRTREHISRFVVEKTNNVFLLKEFR